MSVALSALGELVEPVESWSPERNATDSFVYIDLSAVDQDAKAVTGARHVPCAEAPSRAKQLVAAGDVLVSTVRPNLNAVALVPPGLDGATASTGFCVLRPRRERLDSAYLLQWVRSPRFVSEMVRRATGASYPAVSDRIILESSLPLPSLSEQRRIADVLDRADALRAKRSDALGQLDTLTRSIFLKMFGDPVTNRNAWPRATLGDVILSVSDGPHVSPAYLPDGVPFLSARHVRVGEITWSDLKFISKEDAQIHWRKCRPERGDILYTKGGTTGLAAAVRTDRPFAVWVHVALVRPDPAKVDSVWLESMLNSTFCYRQSQVLTHGIANRDLGLTRMVNILMFLPPLILQREFARRVVAVETLRTFARDSQGEQNELFASIQHRAFRGEL